MADADPSLQGFLDTVHEISQVTTQQLATPIAHLNHLDQIFVEWLRHAGKIRCASATLLILNSHASFRSALYLALSGQLMPVFMALRGSLESALYANAISVRSELEDVWLHRGRDEATRARCKQEFRISQMFKYLAEAQDDSFADAVRDAYAATIDFGAHPNSLPIVKSTEIVEQANGDSLVDFTYAHGPHSGELRRSLLGCAEVGYLALATSLIASAGHPHIDMLADRANEVQSKLADFISSLGFVDRDHDI